ncbi:MAG: hypothetical protein ABI876_17825, partial [Bacteroidota bacterium]
HGIVSIIQNSLVHPLIRSIQRRAGGGGKLTTTKKRCFLLFLKACGRHVPHQWLVNDLKILENSLKSTIRLKSGLAGAVRRVYMDRS